MIISHLLQRLFRPRLVACNIAEGQHCNTITKLTEAAISTRFLIVAFGTDSAHVAVCSGATNVPLGVCLDEAAAAELPVAIQLLGAREKTVKVCASGVIAVGALVATDTGGKAQTAVATQYPIGRALTAAAADGDVIEIDPMVPQQAMS